MRKRLDVHIKLLEQQRQLEKCNQNLSKTVQDKVHDLAELQYGQVNILADMLEKRDVWSAEHVRRVERYFGLFLSAVIRTGKYDLSADEGEVMIFASRIHDIGKLFLPDVCLKKQGEMQYSDVLEYQKHTLWGGDIIKKCLPTSIIIIFSLMHITWLDSTTNAGMEKDIQII